MRFLTDLRTNIENRDVLVVDDILDTGNTLYAVKEKLLSYKPKSLKTCVLLDKPSRREADVSADYVGFEIDDIFIVGYGLNYGDHYRNVMSVNTLTLVLAIIFLTIGFNIQEKYSFWGTFITEIFIILLPAIFISSTGNIKEVLKVKRISFENILKAIILVILAYPLILLLNGIFLSLLSNFIEYKNFPMELMLQNVPIFNYLIFMCLVPAICEEVFFRGTLTNAYNVYGEKFAISVSALVFALFHFDIQNFIAPFLLGLLFSTLIEVTGSIIPAIVAHFVNNVIAVLTARYVNERLFEFLRKTKLSREIGSLELSIIILLIVVSIFSVILIRLILKNLKKENNEDVEIKIRYRDVEGIDLFNFVPIIALVILYFIYHYIVF